MPWEPPVGPTVFVVPHPDDEVVVMGGLLAHQALAGVSITVLAVTDGDAAYQHMDRDLLASIRRAEQEHSLADLAPHADVRRLAFPDGQVAAREDELTAIVAEAAAGSALIVGPWEHDHHCDHEAAGRAVRRAAAVTKSVLAAGLFWSWTRTESRKAGDGMRALELTVAELDARSTALSRHRSQTTSWLAPQPILDPAALAPLSWSTEYFFVRA